MGAAVKGEPGAMDDRGRAFSGVGHKGRSFFGLLRDVGRQTDGVSATEFALLAPLLIFGLLAMADLGLAVSERMTIGHILRAGAQSATEDVGPALVDTVLRATAAKNMIVAAITTAGTDTALALSVRRVCACAAQPAVEVACSTTCAQNAPTQF